MTIYLLLPLLLVAQVLRADAPAPGSLPHQPAWVGGGFTAAGLHGDYFANALLAGKPAFSRQDVRVHFDWGSRFVVGGSNMLTYRSFPNSAFSVRWTGAIVPRFSERYTITLAADGARLWLNDAKIIDGWATGGSTSATVPLTAGTPYTVKLEYHHVAGPAQVTLRWSSPSTPPEIIDAIGTTGLNEDKLDPVFWADEMKNCAVDTINENNQQKCVFWHSIDPVTKQFRDNNRNNVTPMLDVDENFWPKTDAYVTLSPFTQSFTMPVSYQLTFHGRADVSAWYFWFVGSHFATFNVNGKDYADVLPAGVGYDAASNTTTASLTLRSPSTLCLGFVNSRRTAQSAEHSGVTDVHLYRPTVYGGNTPCAPTSIIRPEVKDALAPYVVVRYIQPAFSSERQWTERTLPAYPSVSVSPPGGGGKFCWEYMIMAANEVGKDLYVSVSPLLTDDYLHKLALLVKYGSDGVNPYSSVAAWPAEGPKYPPLNPNLRLYLEYSNEVWNGGFGQNGLANAECNAALQANSAAAKIVNYDGKMQPGIWANYRRWQAMRTVTISDTFRAVFGDDAMGERIRVLLYDQYGFFGSDLCEFIDNYYNKDDPASTFTGTPHPVSYYVWGGGGAIYYGSSNGEALDAEMHLVNDSFETPAIPVNTAQVAPEGSGWTFTGNAGIFHNIARTAAISRQTTGKLVTPQGKLQVGFKFTVGNKPIYVYDVGRYAAPGNTGGHYVQVVGTNNQPLSNTLVGMAETPTGQYRWAHQVRMGWLWQPNKPLPLDANKSYYIFSEEAGGDQYYDQTTAVSAVPGITINCPATMVNGAITDGPAGSCACGPVNFRFADAPEQNGQSVVGFVPDASDGEQAAFIGDTGSIAQSYQFTKTGIFALWYYAAVNPSAPNQVDIYLDDQKVSANWGPGAFERPADDLSIAWGSAVFTIDKPGTHMIKIKGVGQPGQYIFFDKIRFMSEDGLFGGAACNNMPYGGQAWGQDSSAGWRSTIKLEAGWAQSFGLQLMAYEGGWSVGGDFDQKPFQLYAKYHSDRSITADNKAMSVYQQLGGRMATLYYLQWPFEDTQHAQASSMVKAAAFRADHLPAEATYGLTIPGVLTPANTLNICNRPNGEVLAAQDWRSWNVIAPRAGAYQLTCSTGGTGSLELRLDDRSSVLHGAAGTALSGTAWLSKGLHNFRLRNTSPTTITLKQVVVTMANAPQSPTLQEASMSNGTCRLQWTPVAGATSYQIAYGEEVGYYTTFVDTGIETTATIPGMNEREYYVAVAAVDRAQQTRGIFSNVLRVVNRTPEREAQINLTEQAVTHESNRLTVGDYLYGGYSNWGKVSVVAAPKKRLYTTVASTISIERADAAAFDLSEVNVDFDNATGSVVITGTNAAGTIIYTRLYNNPDGKARTTTLPLDFIHVYKAVMVFYSQADGAGNGCTSGLLSFIVNKSGPAVVASMPAITLTTPVDGVTYTAPATITITAMAHTPAGIERVEFYAGTDKIGVAYHAPFTCTWAKVAAGSYQLTARVTDTQMHTTTTPAMRVMVK